MRQCIKSLRLNHLGNVPFVLDSWLVLPLYRLSVANRESQATIILHCFTLFIHCCTSSAANQARGSVNLQCGKLVIREWLVQNCRMNSAHSPVTANLPLSKTLNHRQLLRCCPKSKSETKKEFSQL